MISLFVTGSIVKLRQEQSPHGSWFWESRSEHAQEGDMGSGGSQKMTGDFGFLHEDSGVNVWAAVWVRDQSSAWSSLRSVGERLQGLSARQKR